MISAHPRIQSKAHFQHTLDWFQGPESNLFVHFNRWFEGLQASLQFFKGVESHVRAGIAAAAIQPRHIQEGFVRNSLFHLVNDARFGQHNECVGVAALAVSEQFAGGSDEISQVEQVLLALGMGDYFGSGMFQFHL